MKIGIIGSGQVAQTLGAKLLDLGHEVMVSSRDLNAKKDLSELGTLPSANSWKENHVSMGHKAKAGNFSEAAEFGEIIFNCTTGSGSLDALSSAGEENLRGKILIDLANPLDFSKGMPPSLFVCNDDSLGEQIQREFKETKVVKTLNTVNANVMVNPSIVSGDHCIFMAGNDSESKKWVKDHLLTDWFGWKNIIDLGDITASRGMEMYLPLWLRLLNTLKTPNFNIQIVK